MIKNNKIFLLIIFIFFFSSSILSGVTVYVGPTRTYTTISAAINAHPPSSVLDIRVDPGIYTENIDDPTKQISITGSGNGTDPSIDTIIRKITNDPIIRINTTGTTIARVIFRNFRIELAGNYAFEFPDSASISYITFDNLEIVGDPATWGESEIGIKVSTYSNVFDIEILGCTFSYMDYALYFAKHGDWNPSTSNVSDFVMRDSVFDHNDYKGAYIEKLSDALFDNVTVADNGNTDFWNSRWNAGIDINLKGDDYQNITFTGCLFQNNAKSFRDGAALMIKARDDGSTYGTYPATLTNVTITACEFRDNERGIRMGEPDRNNAGPSNVVIRDSVITGNVQAYTGTDGSEYGGIVNYSNTQTDAILNYWDVDCTGPYHATANISGLGDTVYGDVIFNPWRCYSSPVAIIKTDPDPPTGIVPLQVEFNALSSYSPSGSITSYLWYLGDGTTSTNPVLSHTYYNTGTYRVILTVTDNAGIQDSAEGRVRVLDSSSVTAKMWTEQRQIKAYGKELTVIFAELYNGTKKLKNSCRVSFQPGSGSVEGMAVFNSSNSQYSQVLRSGTEGSDSIRMYLNGNFITETGIDYIWIQPPPYFSVDLYNDSKIFIKNYIAELKWTVPQPIYENIVLKGFRLYRSGDGSSWALINELPSSLMDMIDNTNNVPVWYRITSIDTEGNESRGFEIRKEIK